MPKTRETRDIPSIAWVKAKAPVPEGWSDVEISKAVHEEAFSHLPLIKVQAAMGLSPSAMMEAVNSSPELVEKMKGLSPLDVADAVREQVFPDMPPDRFDSLAGITRVGMDEPAPPREPSEFGGKTIAEPPVMEEPTGVHVVTEEERRREILGQSLREEEKIRTQRQRTVEAANFPSPLFFESMLQTIEQNRFNAMLLGLEGADDARVSMGRFLGFEETEPIMSKFIDLYRRGEEATGVPAYHFMKEGAFMPAFYSSEGQDDWAPSMKDYDESWARMLGKPLVQMAPVMGGMSLLSKIPMIAAGLGQIPTGVQLAGAGGTIDLLSFEGKSPKFSELFTKGTMDFLKNHPDDTEMEGRLKNFVEGAAMGSGFHYAMKAGGKVFRGLFGALDETLAKTVDPIITPINTRLEKIHPAYKKRMQMFELEQNTLSAQYFQKLEPFLRGFQKMSKADQQLFDSLTKTGSRQSMYDASKILKKYEQDIPGIKSAFKHHLKAYDEMYDLLARNGVKMPRRPNYIPRVVENYKGLRGAMGLKEKGKLETMLAEAKKKKSVDGLIPLTEHERIEVANRFFAHRQTLGENLGFTKQRQIDVVDAEYMPFYYDFVRSAQIYTDNMAYIVAKRRLLGKTGAEMQDTSLGAITNKMRAEYDEWFEAGAKGDKIGISQTDADLAADLFETRIRGGQAKLGSKTKIWRDSVYATLLANPIAAITQAGEAGLNAYRYGLLPTWNAAGEMVLSKVRSAKMRKAMGAHIGVSPRAFTQIPSQRMLGIREIAAEFADPSKVTKGLHNMMTLSGFKHLDAIMKDHNLVSALNKARGQLKTKAGTEVFRKENAKFFENETDDLIKAIRQNDINDDNVRLFLYSNLAKTQPIALSEMPELYLKMTNGRAWYFLKSFTLKQFNTVREDIIKQIANPKTTKEGVKNLMRFTAYFGGATTGANWTKDFVLGREFDLRDEALTQFLALAGVSKYGRYKIEREGVVGALSMFAPAIPFDRAFKEILNGSAKAMMEGEAEQLLGAPKELVQAVPVVGKILSHRIPGLPGYERIQKEQYRRFMAQKDMMEDFYDFIGNLKSGGVGAAEDLLQSKTPPGDWRQRQEERMQDFEFLP